MLGYIPVNVVAGRQLFCTSSVLCTEGRTVISGQEKVVTETETAILDEEDKEDSGMAATIARQTEGKTLIRLPISRSRLELGTFVSRGYSNYTAAAPP
jgi:hypothetical protein